MTCIYTAIVGGYNPLQPHPEIDGIEWVAFTDWDTPADSNWQIRRIRPNTSPRLFAKKYKLLPHLYLPEFPKTIWIDGTVRVDSPSILEALSCTHDGIAMFRHPQRHDIFSEAEVSMVMPKYMEEPIWEQVDSYRAAGIPPHGLWAATVIAREDNDQVRELGEMWLDQIQRWSIQDQISLPYCLWRLGIEPGAFPASLYDNPWLTVTGHNPNF